MRFTIASRGCKISEEEYEHIENHIRRLALVLPNFDPDLTLIDIIIKRHKKDVLIIKQKLPKAQVLSITMGL